ISACTTASCCRCCATPTSSSTAWWVRVRRLPASREAESRMGSIVCFGEILIDLLAQSPASPEQPRAFLQYAGGAPANVAVAAARLGIDTQFVGMLGRDMFGDFLADSLAQHGVGTDYIARTDAAKTALAFVALDT